MNTHDRHDKEGAALPPEVDAGSGEILSGGGAQDRRMRDVDVDVDAIGATITGERSIPCVNRERSIQARISGFLALAAFVLLGAGFLVWYYSTQHVKTRDAALAARKAAAARAGGEMKVPPLGRIEPPPSAVALTPPPTSSAPSAIPPPPPTGPAAKTPAQLAMERKLSAPVLRRAQALTGTADPPAQALASNAPTSAMPSMAQILGAMQAPGVATPSHGSGLAANLQTTATPAVAARVLPTRQLLLPKGAFIDCTLETAIDSSYEGMSTCIGAQDVYGADGKVVLLERGTKYVGEQRGAAQQGQGRIFVLWNEARTPTGVVVQLASPGTDELGRSGLPGFVDTHFWDRFGAAILISVIDATVQAISGRQQGSAQAGSNRDGLWIRPQGSQDVTTQVLRNTISIPPTVIKNQGERIQILVARDVDFRTVYALRTEPAAP